MTEQEQRIKIAEVCGWTTTLGGRYVHPKGESFKNLWVDPLDDLNAMHKAELELREENYGDYETFLMEICCPDNFEAESEFELDSFFPCIHATAAQRAEAFLKTKGLWK